MSNRIWRRRRDPEWRKRHDGQWWWHIRLENGRKSWGWAGNPYGRAARRRAQRGAR